MLRNPTHLLDIYLEIHHGWTSAGPYFAPPKQYNLRAGDLGQHTNGGVVYKTMVMLQTFYILLLMAEILHHLGCMKPYK